MANGALIAFEGGEGSGKNVQIHRLSAELIELGKPILLTREPGGTEEGQQLRRMLVTGDAETWEPMSELLLITASRIQHVNKIIRPALEMGQIVLCDRFVGSTLAYQGAAGGIPTDVILRMHEQATDDLWPDLTIILDVDPVIGLERARAKSLPFGCREDRFGSKALEFHRKVREGFLEQAENDPHRCVVIDASRDVDAIYEDIRHAVFDRLNVITTVH